MPVSLWLFAATLIVYLVQLFPYTGIFLMFLLAPFWSVVLVNLGFAGIVFEVVTGRVSKEWLLAPLFYFGGYIVFAWQSHLTFDNLDAELRAANSGKTIVFDPASHALVLGGSNENSGSASTLVKKFDIPVAYEENKNFKPYAHIAHRLAGKETCERIRKDGSYGKSGIHAFGVIERNSNSYGALVEGICSYYAPEDPTLPRIIITTKADKPVNTWLLTYTLYRTTITDDAKGKSIELLTASASPYSYFPMPVAGCGLNSGKPSWDCFHGFQRGKMRGAGADGGYGGSALNVTVAALGLRRSPASGRVEAINQRSSPQLAKVVAGRLESSLANLERMIDNPAQTITIHDLAGIDEKPAEIVPRATRIIDALGRAFKAGAKARESAVNLQRLLASLPLASFRQHGAAILGTFKGYRTLDPDYIESTLLTRLGDLGADAVPLLQQLAFEISRTPQPSAIFGLCRVGRDAAPLAETIASALATSKKRHHGNLHASAYVTLLRLGRPDLIARNDPDPDGHFGKMQYEQWRSTITPDSPASVCADLSGWPRIAD